MLGLVPRPKIKKWHDLLTCRLSLDGKKPPNTCMMRRVFQARGTTIARAPMEMPLMRESRQGCKQGGHVQETGHGKAYTSSKPDLRSSTANDGIGHLHIRRDDAQVPQSLYWHLCSLPPTPFLL
jgi:hypothetical protein